MGSIPYNTARGAASSLQMSPPFAFSDVTMSVFPLRASLSRLETFCDSYLNQAPSHVQFKPFIPFVYLVILDYGRMSLQAANMGWVSQREVAFGIPLRWLNMIDGKPVFHDWAFSSPFIFVDNELSMSTGREVYGWPKLLARLDPSVSEWVRDPHGARRVFQVSTKRAAHGYTGETTQYRPFLSVYQDRAAGLFDVPPRLHTITRPIQQLSSNLAGAARLGGDLLRTFAGMASEGITGTPILPDMSDQDTFRAQLSEDKLRSWTNPTEWVPGLRDALWSLFPRTYANTINIKQFRDAGDPQAACYQAITTARMPAKSIARGGFLGPQNMMLGQLDGGFRIDVHSLAGLPIVQSLGLEVAAEYEADGVHVSSLCPVCPLWLEVDMTYGLAETLVWRGISTDWKPGNHLDRLKTAQRDAPERALDRFLSPRSKDGAPGSGANAPNTPGSPTTLKLPEDREEGDDSFDLDYIRTMNFFNTARGATEAVGGAFSMPNAQIRVLPIKADHAALNRFVEDYLTVNNQLRFDAWGDYVYLIICDFDQINSAVNAVAKRRAREINLAVPVKCYRWFNADTYRDMDPTDPEVVEHKARKNLVTTGFVSAFSFVDDTGTAITASEVSGIPTLSAAITSPDNDWLSIDLSQDRAKRDILDMTASVLPALMTGAQTQARSLIQLHSHSPVKTQSHQTQTASINEWVGLLADDLARKHGEAQHQNLSVGQGFALQLLAGELPINQFSLKQFRDARFTQNACYQALVQRQHRLQKLGDLRELEDPLHVSITDYPTQPMSELLGLKPKFSYPGRDRIVRVYEALRPFSMTANLVREAGHTLFERIEDSAWKRGSVKDQIFGWQTSTRARGYDVVGIADRFDDDEPIELRYTCELPQQKRTFRLHARKVKAPFLRNWFKPHLDVGNISELFIRERNRTGLVHVVTDPALLDAVSNGTTNDIAAYSKQLRAAGKTTVMTQAEAASALSQLSPATIADSLLSRQWGLAAGSPRREEKKPDFCVPAETVPAAFSDILFPKAERLYDYWPLSEAHFKSESNRRLMEVLGFRYEVLSFVGSVSSFAAMKVALSGDSYPLSEEDVVRVMKDQLRKDERADFERLSTPVLASKEGHAEKIANLYVAFANAMLPAQFAVPDLSSRDSVMSQITSQAVLISSEDWRQIKNAIPRMLNVASAVFADDPNFRKGVEEMASTFRGRAKKNQVDIAQLEFGLNGHAQDAEMEEEELPTTDLGTFYLQDPSEMLSRRLADLVTGGALHTENERDPPA